ncbi:membrane dipeptidase [Peribacillus saganii]|uniref:Membrane dipeptidase n=1 Tax=Peribacillus saganii TaxID=2303992 RepID=A0A372LQE2_9BACI|nr:dipeptidase [Peribacillus saganii]RFU69009.1 membrane dipeptidase [Peribacillus saganii]
MRVIDLHCDALLRLWDSKGKLKFGNAPEIQTNKNRLQQGGVMLQGFAIWIDPDMKQEQKFQAALEQIDIFYKEVIGQHPEMKPIKDWSDIDSLQDGEIGAMLTLEGVDAIGNDIKKLSILHQLGVKSVGLTWNNANLAADGAGEPRGAGLTLFGKEIVRFNNEHQILTDVSHLSEKGFWDVMEIADYPISSHSNSRKIYDHPRNLTDEQAIAMFKNGGMVHVIYCPYFTKADGITTISDLMKHIDHFCSLGGVKHLGFGSDFDGISSFIKGLEDASQTQNLINELLKYYKEEEVSGFAYRNFLNHRPKKVFAGEI